MTQLVKSDYIMVEIEDGPHGHWTTYRRNGYQSWEVLMGGSWEACYSDDELLESLLESTYGSQMAADQQEIRDVVMRHVSMYNIQPGDVGSTDTWHTSQASLDALIREIDDFVKRKTDI